MLNNILVLLKVNILNSFKQSKKSKHVKLIYIFLFFASFIISFSYSIFLTKYLVDNNITQFIFPAYHALGIILMLLMSINKAKGSLFEFKDSDLLFSMPIHEESILIQKVIKMMIFNYLISFLIVIPPSITYSFFVETNYFYWFSNLMVFIFLPIIPTIISALIGYVIGNFSSKLKRKSIFETVATFIIVGIISTFIFNIDIDSLIDKSSSVEMMIKNYFYPLYLNLSAIVYGNISPLILLAIGSTILFILFIFTFSKFFISANKKSKEKFSNKNFNMQELKVNKPIMSMFRKEFLLYTQSSIYIINTCFGAISMLIFAISSHFYDISIINQTILEYSGLQLTSFQLLTLICATMAPLSCTTPASISMEGKSLWIYRSMPISERNIYMSKAMVDMIVIIPINIIAMIIASFSFNLQVKETIVLFLLIFTIGTTMTQFGLLLNIYFPVLKYNSDLEAVKNNTSANLAVYIPIIVNGVVMLIYAFITELIPFFNFVLILTILFAFTSIFLFIFFEKLTKKRFTDIHC